MTIPEPWMPPEPANLYCPACGHPTDQCTCGITRAKPASSAPDRKLCPIWDCQCPAGQQLRTAWTDMNRILDQHGDSPQYRTAWANIERLEAQRQTTCHCPTT